MITDTSSDAHSEAVNMFYLIGTLSVQLLLVVEPIHHLIHELQRDLSVFKFGAYVVILNRCDTKLAFYEMHYHNVKNRVVHINALCYP